MTSIRLLIAAVIALATAFPAVAGERVVISTGLEGGSYYFIGQRLKTELILRNALLPKLKTSQGSLENLARLADPSSDVNVALAQADALHSHLGRHPDFLDRFFVLGDMGRECAFIITRRDGSLASAADLKRERAGRLAVGSPGSGAAVTFEAMVSLDPAFAATERVHVPVIEALLQLEQGRQFTKIEAVMLVQRPRRLSPPLRAVLEGTDDYRFLPLKSSDVPNASLPDGTPLYTFERVAVGGKKAGQRQEVETFCTRALLLGSQEKLDHETRDALSRLMIEKREEIAGSDE
jgi:hypothetical protein